MKKVELLAPAGNYESFIAAINAGADAVYLAGNQFGARAYADNFSSEEVCQAIRYAHLFHRKVYLTVNILLKDNELAGLYEYLNPFYQCGLDGVIVQDTGAFKDMQQHFPELELHASTQMTLTGSYGAKMLKEMGATRIVPARELSLEEIREIKKNVDIEIEAFVHGAECYCYSGACLFSSILGGRSGNRGRCAQPCRLPYEVLTDSYKKVTKEEQYVLSLKDMCTLSLIPKLIEAGIDSFKIEGRMKKPEYAAGVTAIYRKYIDLYYGTPDQFQIEEQDLMMLRKLYIRSELQDGYYRKHNGKEMVTLSKPSYSGSDDNLLTMIRNQYIEHRKKVSVNLSLSMHPGQPMKCIIWEPVSGETISVLGDVVQEASKRPVEKETVMKQLLKTGNTNFSLENIEIDMDDSIFIPLKAINVIRRDSLDAMEQKLIGEMRISRVFPLENAKQSVHPASQCQTALKCFYAVVNSMEQLDTVIEYPLIDAIYVSSDLLESQSFQDMSDKVMNAQKKLYIALPYIVRKRSYTHLEHIFDEIQSEKVQGVMIRNFESLQWLRDKNYQKEIHADAAIYCFNHIAKDFALQYVTEVTASYELNLKELLQLGLEQMSIPVYGRIPMMISANCIRKTTMSCDGDLHRDKDWLLLEDRYNKNFYVKTNCLHCYNVIYNGQPSSLHGYVGQFINHHVNSLRLDFTTEKERDVREVISFFEKVITHPNEKITPPYKEFTKGHLARGVE